jgi:hypothetical protein
LTSFTYTIIDGWGGAAAPATSGQPGQRRTGGQSVRR